MHQQTKMTHNQKTHCFVCGFFTLKNFSEVCFVVVVVVQPLIYFQGYRGELGTKPSMDWVKGGVHPEPFPNSQQSGIVLLYTVLGTMYYTMYNSKSDH